MIAGGSICLGLVETGKQLTSIGAFVVGNLSLVASSNSLANKVIASSFDGSLPISLFDLPSPSPALHSEDVIEFGTDGFFGTHPLVPHNVFCLSLFGEAGKQFLRTEQRPVRRQLRHYITVGIPVASDIGSGRMKPRSKWDVGDSPVNGVASATRRRFDSSAVSGRWGSASRNQVLA